jgi:translocator protein
MNNNWSEWYQALEKPLWTPPPSVIGTVWGLLYPLIFATYGYVLFEVIKGRLRPVFLIPFVVNLIANFAFTYLFMGQKNLIGASIDVAVIWITIVATMIILWPNYRTVAYLQIPYLLWVTIAGSVMIAITILNR